MNPATQLASHVQDDPIARARGARTVFGYFSHSYRCGGAVDDLYEDLWECHCMMDDVLLRSDDRRPKPPALYEEMGLMMAWFDAIDYARESGLDASDSETVCRLLSEQDREARG